MGYRTMLGIEHLEPRLALATITGSVYQDLNLNGSWDASEPAAIFSTVYLDLDENRERTSADIVTESDFFGGHLLE